MRATPAVDVSGLTKSFRVRRSRPKGVAARVRDVFAPQTETVVAVDGLSLSVRAGERLRSSGPTAPENRRR
jgi:hypothetical protein